MSDLKGKRRDTLAPSSFIEMRSEGLQGKELVRGHTLLNGFSPRFQGLLILSSLTF